MVEAADDRLVGAATLMAGPVDTASAGLVLRAQLVHCRVEERLGALLRLGSPANSVSSRRVAGPVGRR